ncbi:histidinol-phosphatase [Brucepastera parasyntrophica]|uniref:histidinol-phosphatase n=1 Tax=Brucepastera parasyntrophica TaxID=2880008 RepID=UPI00210D6316|nr:histidinol-phosphatase [Brucepastera parasyntrophica]ULQ59279.1 histidinol-phosphatase [Brucepastera parasyntrophica]
MRKHSYHIHTVFCDGKSTPEEMVKAALDGNMECIGFSAHAAWPFATEWHLPPARYQEYIDEISRLKTLYGQRIHILCGFEADYLPDYTFPDRAIYRQFNPEYLIGSVHYITADKQHQPAPVFSVDAPAAEVAKGLAEVFKNNGKKAVQKYWDTVRNMVSSCDFDIIGHLDVHRKRNGELRFFDESEPWYRRELKETVKVIARSGKVVEINTGGIARKAIDDVYPSAELLSLLHARDVPLTVSSDAHRTGDILCAYERAYDAARRAGYTKIALLTSSGWTEDNL